MIGHYWVPPGLRTRLSAQHLIWKWFFILMQIKLIFTWKGSALGLTLKVRVLELGSGLLRTTRRSPQSLNLQVVITHASHVCSQHSFGLPLRMNGMHRTLFDHAHFDLLPLVIWSRMFWPSVTRNLRKALTAFEQKCLTLDHCHAHSVTFGYY